MNDVAAGAAPPLWMPGHPVQNLGRYRRAAWLLCIVATWMLLHLYQGLRHDASMYAMQGMAHQDLKYWAQDVFLRFGSQDQFSAFPRLFAKAIGWFGLEPAAAILTGIAELAFFLAAWRLALLLLPEREALMGLFLLVALPGTYGSVDIFHVVEDFITPRLLAEGLVLAAIVNGLQQRRMLALLCMAMAVAVHPLMAAVGVALYLWLSVAQPRPRLTAVLALIAIAALALVRLRFSGPPLRFDDVWFQISPKGLAYLLIGRWDGYVWGATLAPLILLAAGSVLLERQPARRVAQAGLGIGIAGIALTAYGGDLLHLTLIIQGQPWRCLWFSTAIATLLLPLIVPQLWRRNDLARATVLVLLAEYILVSEHYSVALAPLSLLLLALSVTADRSVPLRAQRLVLYGAVLVLLLAFAITTADLAAVRLAYFPHVQFDAPLWVKRVREILHSPLLPFALLGMFCWVNSRLRERWDKPLVLLGALVCCALVPVTWQAWSRAAFQPDDRSLFASWRAQIPPGTEVLFPEDPVFVWYVLERPSYISRSQATSALFSRPAAMFMYGRTLVLLPYLRAVGQAFWDADSKAETPDHATLAMACRTSDLQFVASRGAFDEPPIAQVPVTAKSLYRGLKLYRCPQVPN